MVEKKDKGNRERLERRKEFVTQQIKDLKQELKEVKVALEVA